MLDDAICIQATGVNITTGASSANATIPNASNGNKPNYIRVSATAACYVKVGQAGLSAAAGDILIIPADAVVLKVQGCTTVAAIQQAAAGICQISPLEDL